MNNINNFSLLYNGKKIVFYYYEENSLIQVLVGASDIFDPIVYDKVHDYLKHVKMIEDKEYITLPSILQLCYSDEVKLEEAYKKKYMQIVQSLEIAIKNELNKIRKKNNNTIETKEISTIQTIPTITKNNKKEETKELQLTKKYHYINQDGLLSTIKLASALEKTNNYFVKRIEKLKNDFGKDFLDIHFILDHKAITTLKNNQSYNISQTGFVILLQKMKQLDDYKDIIHKINIEFAQKNLEIGNSKLSTKDDRVILNRLVHKMAKEFSLEPKEIWIMIKERFGYSSIKYLPLHLVEKAENFIEMKSFEYRMSEMIKNLALNINQQQTSQFEIENTKTNPIEYNSFNLTNFIKEKMKNII